MKKYRYYLFLILSITCVPLDTHSRQLVLTDVFIGNEGNFGNSNATLSHYNPASGQISNSVFFNANGIGLGDVLQSMVLINEKLYAVVNNSSRIVVMNPETFQQTGLINTGSGSSPRELVAVAPEKAYVTDLFANLVRIINLATNTMQAGSIPVGQNPDKMLLHDGFVYVANNGFGADSTIFKINPASDAVVDTFVVGRGPAGMLVDLNENLWVVSTGFAGEFDENFNIIPGTSKPGGLHRINLSTGEVREMAVFDSSLEDIGINKAGTEIYFVSNGLRVFNVETEEEFAQPLFEGNFWAMGFEPETEVFYLTTAKDFVSAGDMFRVDLNGNLLNTFEVGIIPGDILFGYEEQITVSIEDEFEPTRFRLMQNYPNPFNPSTTIEFLLNTAGPVTLSVFDVSGRLVSTLINGNLASGKHRATFDASGLASGVYVYQIRTEAFVENRKMTLIK